MKNILYFENHTDYASKNISNYMNSVSLCDVQNDVHYIKSNHTGYEDIVPIEYLYNSNNAYIDSKIPFTTNSKWITQFEFQNKGNGGDLFGLRTPWSIIRLNNYIYIDRYYQGSSSYNRVINKKGWWSEANVRKITSIEITDTYIIADGTASTKTTFASAGTNTYKTLDSGGAAICGGLSGKNDPLKIFYFKWYENSTLVLDLIPVRINNVGYMYDKVSGQLFGNSGTGNFELGPDL